MLNFLIGQIKKSELACFWFDARATAVDYYNKYGIKQESEAFNKRGVQYYKMFMHF